MMHPAHVMDARCTQVQQLLLLAAVACSSSLLAAAQLTASAPDAYKGMSARGLVTADMFKNTRQSYGRDFKLPPPVQVYSGTFRVREKMGGSGGIAPPNGRQGRNLELDLDGVPIIEGVRMPDDPKEANIVYRNARIINNVLVRDQQGTSPNIGNNDRRVSQSINVVKSPSGGDHPVLLSTATINSLSSLAKLVLSASSAEKIKSKKNGSKPLKKFLPFTSSMSGILKFRTPPPVTINHGSDLSGTFSGRSFTPNEPASKPQYQRSFQRFPYQISSSDRIDRSSNNNDRSYLHMAAERRIPQTLQNMRSSNKDSRSYNPPSARSWDTRQQKDINNNNKYTRSYIPISSGLKESRHQLDVNSPKKNSRSYVPMSSRNSDPRRQQKNINNVEDPNKFSSVIASSPIINVQDVRSKQSRNIIHNRPLPMNRRQMQFKPFVSSPSFSSPTVFRPSPMSSFSARSGHLEPNPSDSLLRTHKPNNVNQINQFNTNKSYENYSPSLGSEYPSWSHNSLKSPSKSNVRPSQNSDKESNKIRFPSSSNIRSQTNIKHAYDNVNLTPRQQKVTKSKLTKGKSGIFNQNGNSELPPESRIMTGHSNWWFPVEEVSEYRY